MDNSRHPAAEVLDDVSQIIEDNDGSVTVSRLAEELGHKSLSAVLAVPALAVVSPLSGVPLFSSTCGILICLVSGHMLFGRSNLWLPGWLGRKRIEGARAEKAISAMRRAANWLDRHASKRMQVVLSQPFISLIRLVCLLCGALMPVLEVVPFSSSILGAAVALLALSMLTRDGLIAVLTLVALACAGVGVLVGLF
ncbi:exopolysaccharide biosynthesis protein [Leisingera sp. XS_AS12]|uniref:exopolysaccharide biosynthesis protein n=1 Tax=Leisingera sp. XS_AS12 TaxID=3241294 RepID=UPI003511A742